MEEQFEPPCTNIPSSDLDEETVKKLRGDAIGDTLYSETFVVKTLMQFSDLQWCEKIEEDLCFLWDMSEEPDVCKYLLQVSYPELACAAITNNDESRFIEIVVGILSNILCSKCYKNVKRQEIDIILNLLNSDDPYILIQVMRFVHAVSFLFDKLDFVDDDHITRFCFILDNSTNKELLGISLKAMSVVTDDLKLDANLVRSSLFISGITAFTSFKKHSNSSFESQEVQTNLKYLVKLACNLCVYVDSCNLCDLKSDLNSNLFEFFSKVSGLLWHFTKEDNLFPIDESFTFYIEALTYFCRILGARYASNIVVPLCQILSYIVKRKDGDSLQICAELLCYYITLESEDCLADMLKMPWMKPVLIEIERSKLMYDFDYLKHVQNMIKNFE